jgi:hypothetical protein
VAREKVSQCLRDMFKVASNLGNPGEKLRDSTEEAPLSGIELDEAKAFVRATTAALTLPQPNELDGESPFSGPLLKRSRSVPNWDAETDRPSFLKRPRQYASLSELGKETFGTYSYINTTFSALPSHQLPLGELCLELPNSSNYSLNSSVSESCLNGKPSDEEACVNQAFLKADQLKNDDSAFHRLIDRMILEEL